MAAENAKRPRRPIFRGGWRRIHLVTGLGAGLWLLLLAVTGVLINHQEALGLLDVLVTPAYLPDHYSDGFHPEGIALGVVVADLHSGRFFGEWGRLIADTATLLLVISVLTGAHGRFAPKRRAANGASRTR